jgi:hypothetical protein
VGRRGSHFASSSSSTTSRRRPRTCSARLRAASLKPAVVTSSPSSTLTSSRNPAKASTAWTSTLRLKHLQSTIIRRISGRPAKRPSTRTSTWRSIPEKRPGRTRVPRSSNVTFASGEARRRRLAAICASYAFHCGGRRRNGTSAAETTRVDAASHRDALPYASVSTVPKQYGSS